MVRAFGAHCHELPWEQRVGLDRCERDGGHDHRWATQPSGSAEYCGLGAMIAPVGSTVMTRLQGGKSVDFWAEDLKMKPLVTIDVQEVSAAGPVTQDDNVRVSAIIVEHPPVKPALAYRFDFKDRSIAFSGDTAPLDAVAKMAKGADVLVHETMYVPAVEKYIQGQIARGRPVKFDAFMAHMKADHTPSEDVGRIAQEAGVKTLVLSHLTPAIDSISDDTWREPAAKYFKGEIVVGKDLMVV